MSLYHRWLFGGIGVAILVFLIGFFLVVNPARNNANAIASQAADQEQQNIATQAKIDQYSAQVSEVPAKQAEIAAVQEKLPPTLELPEMIREIEGVADDAGLRLLSITPSTPSILGEDSAQSAGGVPTVSVPVAITARGSYTTIKSFVNGLERMSRAYFVSGLDITADGENASELELSLQGQVFSVPADSLPNPTAEATPSPTPSGPTTTTPGASPAPSTAVPEPTPNSSANTDVVPAPTSGQAAAQLPQKNGSNPMLDKAKREVVKAKKQQRKQAAQKKAAKAKKSTK